MDNQYAKHLRQAMTDAEKVLWHRLRAHRLLGEKFRRQQPIGVYIVDFVHFGARLIVEADGGQHADSAHDIARDAWLRHEGFKILRFWNNEILTETEAVLEKILAEVAVVHHPSPPTPLPQGERGAPSPRPIRSYVRRESRMTAAQERAIAQWWPRYGIDIGEATLDLSALFGRTAPRVLEIGFGNGEALLAAARVNPQCDYLGVEVHRPGVAQVLRELAAHDIGNVRVACVDVNDVLARMPDASLTAVCLFFPDPWPKKRHHKRRLVQPHFVELLRAKLALGGSFYLATDWEDYAAHMLEVLLQAPGFENAAGAAVYAERPALRPLTKFERRGQRLGHVVRDFVFRRVR